MVEGVGIHGELFGRLCDPGWLMISARAAAKGKRRKPDVAAFLLELEPECFALAEALGEGRYQPGVYRSFRIFDPKPRLISAAPFRDRVVHHALVALLEPHFERRFSPFSFACRKGRGTHRALERGQRLMRERRFVLKGDVVKFFPSLDHAIVKACVRRVIADEPFLRVLDGVIDGSNPQDEVLHWFSGDGLFSPFERRLGLPIGNLTSQFLANVVLDHLDHFITDGERFGDYVRYCDDFLVFSDDVDRLPRLREHVIARLALLRLKLHERKGGVHSTRGPIPFLGFALRRRGPRRLLRPAIVRATRRLTALVAGHRAGEVSAARLAASLLAWNAHAAGGGTTGVRRRILQRAGIAVDTPPNSR